MRIAKEKSKLEKGYDRPFTEEVFKIVQVICHLVPVYKLEDLKGEPIKGSFYKSGLSLVRGYQSRAPTIDKVAQAEREQNFRQLARARSRT